VARVLEARPTSGARLKLAQVMLEDPEVADAYQELFGHLRLAPELAAILVTSAAPDEGKTTVSLCLAATASCAGQTALLIDGDLRAPLLDPFDAARGAPVLSTATEQPTVAAAQQTILLRISRCAFWPTSTL
jgi:Mrp family chromosome partitioning ATPase